MAWRSADRRHQRLSNELPGETNLEKQLRTKHAKSFVVDCFSSGTHGLEETVQFLRHLDRWFALAAVQANNWWPPHEAAGAVIPSFMELSYVSRDVLPDAFTCVPMTQAQILRHAAPERKAVANVAALSPWDATYNCSPCISAYVRAERCQRAINQIRAGQDANRRVLESRVGMWGGRTSLGRR
jgi:hypothetical protein